jgi:oxygen-independent coproporphyrinogen III oxidase
MTSRIPWERITTALLERWGGGAPRYTSYPTAVEWHGGFDAEAFAEALERADSAGSDPLSLYVHIPFCRSRCRFCGCASDVSRETAEYDAYLDALRIELDHTAALLPNRRGVAGLHLGGGTPTVLDSNRLRRLTTLIGDRFDLSDAAELALEAAPAATEPEQIDTLADLGFNRVSFGVQDFTPRVQEAVNRVQSIQATRTLVDRARDHRMGINIDLMYGLPHQTPETWQKTLDTVIDMGADRLAVFGYAHVPWMRPHQKELDEAALPDAALRLALFRAAHERLVEAGYVYIGMDHFALPEDPLAEALANRALWRNFQGYTVRQATILLGFGATAISDLGEVFAQNAPKTAAYQQSVRERGSAIFRGMTTSSDDRLRRQVITELMCNLSLDTDAVSREFNIDFWEYFKAEQTGLARLAEDDLVTYDDKQIRVTALGRMFVRHVGLVFDIYSGEKLKHATFSRTV